MAEEQGFTRAEIDKAFSETSVTLQGGMPLLGLSLNIESYGGVGWKLQCSVMVPLIGQGPMPQRVANAQAWGYGFLLNPRLKWLVEAGEGPGVPGLKLWIAKECFRLAKELVVHELTESLLVNGKQVYNPHPETKLEPT